MKRGKWSKGPKTLRQRQIREADGLLQAAVLRDHPICACCGNRRATAGHHPIHRGNFVTRWRVETTVPVCTTCHNLDGTPRKAELERACIEYIGGQEAWETMVLEANTSPGEHPQDAIDRLKKILDTGENL
jgi:hypothetical protein